MIKAYVLIAVLIALILIFLQIVQISMSFASSLIGAAVGLISSAIFAVSLRRFEEREAKEAIIALRRLAYLVLGVGILDYLIFEVIKKSGTITYYMCGFGLVFMIFGIFIFVDYLRK